MKECPYCHKAIRDAAKKCEFCKRWIDVKQNFVQKASADNTKIDSIGPGLFFSFVLFLLDSFYFLIPEEIGDIAYNFLRIVCFLIFWTYVIRLHKVIQRISGGVYPISGARAVFFSFIPLYNLVWTVQWPMEIIRYSNLREKKRGLLSSWIPGLLFICGGFAGVFAFLLYFLILAYLMETIRHSIKDPKKTVGYKAASIPIGAIISSTVLILVPLIILGAPKILELYQQLIVYVIK